MNKYTRRYFIKNSMAAVGSVMLASSAWPQIRGANDDIRVGIVGVRKKGKEHIQDFRRLSGVRVVAICDADTQWLDTEVKKLKERNLTVETYIDYRKMLENKNVDAVVLCVPDHWHALMTVWACQAGKDVYCEKPASHNIWEGRKMVEAARTYKRIVQVGSQDRSDVGLLPLAEHIKQGGLGKIQRVHAITYNARLSIGKVSGPQPIPTTCDYSLFQGPAPLTPLMRQNLHYDWHWCWPTGTGEMGNLGGHVLDDCRWTTGVTAMSPRVVSLGGRFGYDDDGQTPNTIISLFDYEDFPIIYEIRALPRSKSEKVDTYQGITSRGMDRYRGINFGMIIQCEHGYFSGGRGGGWTYDNNGKKIKQFAGDGGWGHMTNFLETMRSRKVADLKADVEEGHITASMIHTADISYRLAQRESVEQVKKTVEGNDLLAESFDRLSQHLQANEIDLSRNPVAIGPMLTFDTESEKFAGEDSFYANMFLSRNYRPPFVVSEAV
ncbi:Gfo/Idh/MocA family protein [Planctomycetota bacterium]